MCLRSASEVWRNLSVVRMPDVVDEDPHGPRRPQQAVAAGRDPGLRAQVAHHRNEPLAKPRRSRVERPRVDVDPVDPRAAVDQPAGGGHPDRSGGSGQDGRALLRHGGSFG